MMMILADSCCDLSPELLKRRSQSRAVDHYHRRYALRGRRHGGYPAVSGCDEGQQKPGSLRLPVPGSLRRGHQGGGRRLLHHHAVRQAFRGSHNAAVLGVQLAEEDMPEKKVHVFDSESASAGETYLALMIHDLIAAGKSFEQIVETVEEKIRSMHTLFVLDSLDNLVKNGRISKTVALLANVLSIRLLMSDDGHGAIKNISKARGIKGALTQMVETCRKHTEGLAAASQRLVISYCNCPERARQVRDMIREKCPAIGEIVMTPTSALSSMYANDGGVVIAY